jgi:transcriptional regulator with XRE-family HTH domain
MPFNRVVELGGFIREQRHKAQMSLRTVANLSGISNPYLSQIERGLRKPSAEILQGIAKALRISAETLYVKADPRLSARQKEALIRIYESYINDPVSGAPQPESNGTVPATSEAPT